MVREQKKAKKVRLSEVRRGFPWAQTIPLLVSRNQPLEVEHQMREAIDNYPTYFGKIRSLLSESGVFLNHGITRRAKRNIKNFGKLSSGKKVILKYIFPGSELDHIGHTVQVMESCGFDVHDVEGLRLHYAQTCRLWYERLAAHRKEAVAIVGPEQYRMWVAYLAGVSVAFEHGPLRIFQTVATRNSSIDTGPLPPTRGDIYREPG